MSQSNHRIQSYGFVGVQFICLGLIFMTGPWVAKNPALLALEMCGGLLAVWAVLTIKLQNLSTLPELKANSPLQTGGPYGWIRHPMYTALLLLTVALLLEEFSYWRGLIWVVLFVDLYLKLQYEEVLLRKTFPEYSKYQQRTHQLLPWVL